MEEPIAAARAPDRLLTAKDVAELWNISEKAVLRLTSDGVIPHVTLGRTIRYRREALDATLERLEHGGRPAKLRKLEPRLRAAG